MVEMEECRAPYDVNQAPDYTIVGFVRSCTDYTVSGTTSCVNVTATLEDPRASILVYDVDDGWIPLISGVPESVWLRRISAMTPLLLTSALR